MADRGGCFMLSVIALITIVICFSDARRFGQKAKTLHFSPSKEDASIRQQMHIINAGESLEGSELKRRVRRSLTTSTTATPPLPTPKDGVNITQVPLNDSHNQMIVHWAGKGSDYIIALAKDILPRNGSTSTVYISSDYGMTFTAQRAIAQINRSTNALIDHFYNSPVANSYYIFTDITHNYTFTTRNYGRSFIKHPVPFKPKLISFHPSNHNVALGMDEDEPRKQLYVTVNFGYSWRRVSYNVKSFSWGVEPFDYTGSIYIERTSAFGGSTILRSTDYFRTNTVVISNVVDFEVRSSYMFATKRDIFNSNNLQLYVSYDRGPFLLARFPHGLPQLDFYIPDASENQVFACVNHNKSLTNLYISDIQGSNFSLSLERIVYFNPEGANNDTWLSYYSKESFADIHKVEGLRGVYIASQLINNSISIEQQTSWVTFDKGGEWQRINAPSVDSEGRSTNCSAWRMDCSLHLTQLLSKFYPGSRSVPILSTESAPGLIIASGTIGKSLKRDVDVFLSQNGGMTWREIMKGQNYFAIGDHGGLLLALPQTGYIDTLYYSYDEGEQWLSHKFSDAKVRVYGVLTEPGEKSAVFSLFGSYVGHHSWLIVQVNLTGIFPYNCNSNDYKEWSMSDELPGRSCLMGTKVVYERRNSHSKCYNGVEYERGHTVSNCSCTRLDYECDFGFELDNNNCVHDPESTIDVHAIPRPCPEGTYYPYSRGYRKVSGDYCSGGDARRYEPLMQSCPIQNLPEFLLYAMRTSIHRYILGDNRDETLVDEGIQNAIAVDYDYNGECLYWADIEQKNIQRLCPDVENNHTLEIIIGDGSDGVDTVEGIAYDWTSKNLYWIDSGTRRIEVSNRDGIFRRKLFDSSYLDKPRAIALDPDQGWMYWTDWSSTNPRVCRAWMDGNPVSLQVLANGSSVYWPNGITVDYQAQKIYWTDAHLKQIMVANTDGSQRRVLIHGASDLPDPYAIAVYKDQLFWTDWLKFAIMTASKIDGNGVEPVLSNLQYILDLKVLHQASQTNHGRCYNNKGGCSQLCLPKPTLIGSTNINRTCLCADNVTRTLQPGGGEMCTCPSGEIMQNGFCMRGAGSNCTFSQFTCSNRRCIPSTWRCDHDNDCHDGSDELDCQYDPCHENYFTCTNSRCIPYRWKCDHDNDCVDNSDEVGCSYPTCESGEFPCNNGRCINATWVCDGDNDCHDSSDEQNCTTREPASCSPSQFSCANQRPRCIPRAWQCDSGRDCSDGSDEMNCSGRTCDGQHFQCVNSSTCIHKNWVCDGDNDCTDRSDEQNCPTSTMQTTMMTTNIPSSCMDFQFRCHNGLCIASSERCDFVNDCGDNSDELMCVPDTTPEANTTCSGSQFTCNNGDCIPLWRRCNGAYDCPDDSDESMCYATTTSMPTFCRGNQFQCYEGGNLHCIYMSWVCDGESDCPHGEDERNCTGATTCPPDSFRCLFSEGCIPDRYVCNGYRDCSDSTDEYGCNSTGSPTTARPTDHCKKNEYSCNTGRCLSYFTFCDGAYDCPGGEDESHCLDSVSMKYVYISSKTNNSITVQWEPVVLPSTVHDNVSYIIAVMQINNYQTWSNKTWYRSNSYTIGKLRPYTQYIVAVYPKVGSTVYKRSSSQKVATEEGVPGQPTNMNAVNTQDATSGQAVLDITWKQPRILNGILTNFNVFYIDQSNLVSQYVPIFSLGADDTVYHTILKMDQLTEGRTYMVYVVAYTRVGGGPPSTSKSIQFDGQGLKWDILNLTATFTSNTVTLTWDAVTLTGAMYEVSYEDAWEREYHITVDSNSYTVKGLTPQFMYQFQVQAVKGPTRGKISSNVVTTAGPPLVAPHDIKSTDIGTHAVSVSWQHAQLASGLTYTLLYSENGGIKTMNKSTTRMSVIIDDLLACETYEFQVAVTGISLSKKSDLVTYTTDYYQNAPAKNLQSSIFNLTCVKITWDAPCVERDIQLGYFVYLRNMMTDSVSKAKPYGNTTDLYLDYSVCGLTRGASYQATVQTTSTNATESAPKAFTVSRYNKPEAIELMREDSVMQWRPPQELVGVGDLAYDVFCRRNDTPNIWQYNVTVHKTKFKLTALHQDVDYVCHVRVSRRNGYPGQFSNPVFVEKPPAVSQAVIYSNTNLIEIVVPICVVVVVLIAILSVLFVRHRRLQRTFLSFANSHYDPRSGRTTFSTGDDLGEDEDSPMITGFSDDEPLVLA